MYRPDRSFGRTCARGSQRPRDLSEFPGTPPGVSQPCQTPENPMRVGDSSGPIEGRADQGRRVIAEASRGRDSRSRPRFGLGLPEGSRQSHRSAVWSSEREGPSN